MLPLAQMVERQGAKGRLLDGLVGQTRAGSGAGSCSRRPVDPVAADGPHSSTAKPSSRRSVSALSASGSVTPGLGSTWTTVPARRGVRRHGTDLERLDHRIGQHLPRPLEHVFLAERSFDQKAATGRDRPGARSPGLGRFDRQSLSNQVGMTRGGMNFKVPEHAWPSWFKE